MEKISAEEGVSIRKAVYEMGHGEIQRYNRLNFYAAQRNGDALIIVTT